MNLINHGNIIPGRLHYAEQDISQGQPCLRLKLLNIEFFLLVISIHATLLLSKVLNRLRPIFCLSKERMEVEITLIRTLKLNVSSHPLQKWSSEEEPFSFQLLQTAELKMLSCSFTDTSPTSTFMLTVWVNESQKFILNTVDSCETPMNWNRLGDGSSASEVNLTRRRP